MHKNLTSFLFLCLPPRENLTRTLLN
jgi:hypothetical protein